ncbi:MAG TPA: lactate racemase domain-containing protein [Gaiellaceae bacterium]|nr:lactate racemase domain-containing protein [Gaiellaceae bacterium]
MAVPLLTGSRIVSVPVSTGDVVLAPPPPPPQARVVDVEAAVRDALAYPLSGLPLGGVVRRGTRVTVVVEPPALPLPGAHVDPRPVALATVIERLSALGVPDERITLLVAGGLARRLGRKDLERLLPPPQARSFRGRVVVHDAEDPALRPLVANVRIHEAVVETDLVLVVSSAESVVHGGPGALVAACDAATIRRAAGARSLVQASGEPAWQLALEVERAVGTQAGVVGVSLVLDHPRLVGRFRGYPHDPRSFDHVARSPFRRLYSLLPGAVRRGILRDLRRELNASAAFAGTPSVAHAEALVRAVEIRGVRLAEPLDAIVVGVPWIGVHVPREPLNPITSAAVALGLALRQWRDAFPVRADGTLVLVHALTRAFAHGTQDPYRVAFEALRSGDDLREAERAAAADARALAAYRAGHACHPLLPFADWAGCQPALARLGRVIVAGSRDATAARALGFVPSHSVASALEMAHGVAEGRARVGVLLAPPYAPLLVGEGEARLAPTG